MNAMTTSSAAARSAHESGVFRIVANAEAWDTDEALVAALIEGKAGRARTQMIQLPHGALCHFRLWLKQPEPVALPAISHCSPLSGLAPTALFGSC